MHILLKCVKESVKTIMHDDLVLLKVQMKMKTRNEISKTDASHIPALYIQFYYTMKYVARNIFMTLHNTFRN